MNIPELVWGVVGFLLTVMILSYLIGDNFFFRLAAYLFVGVTAGFLTVLIARQILWPYLLQPLLEGSTYQRLWVLIPLLLSLMLILSQISQLRALSRIPLAFLAGLTAALVIGGAVFGTMIPQMRAVVIGFQPAAWHTESRSPWMHTVDAVVMLIGVIGTLSYFHFGSRFKRKTDSSDLSRPRLLQALARVGEVFIGFALGAVFAGIFSSALLAMIDRIVFLGGWIARWVGGG